MTTSDISTTTDDLEEMLDPDFLGRQLAWTLMRDPKDPILVISTSYGDLLLQPLAPYLLEGEGNWEFAIRQTIAELPSGFPTQLEFVVGWDGMLVRIPLIPESDGSLTLPEKIDILVKDVQKLFGEYDSTRYASDLNRIYCAVATSLRV